MPKKEEDNQTSNGAFTGAASAPAAAAADWAPISERRNGAREGPAPDFQEEVKRLLFGRYTPAAVLVDDSLDVVHVHGPVEAYLGTGVGAGASNLLLLAKEGLADTLRGAVLLAKSEDRVVSRCVRYGGDGRERALVIDVVVVRSRTDRRRRYLVIFREDPAGLDDAREAAGQLGLEGVGPGAALVGDPAFVAGDELRAAKVQLVASHAELVVLNEELRKGNADLNSINDDLSNLLASSRIPILMLDRRMCVRRFTPPAETAFGLTSADIGQPLAELRLAIDEPRLGEAVRDVLAGFDGRQFEVLSRDERWYSLWVRPYRTDANDIDGAVLSMTDVTERRSGLRALEVARDYAEAIVDAVNDPLLILNRHLKVMSASRAYCQLFRESLDEVEGRSIYELGGGRWNLPLLRKHLIALADRETPFSGWEGEFEVPKTGRRALAVSGRFIPHERVADSRIVLSIEDVTPRRQAAEAAALRKSEARQREFVANVSHELMTPITAIKGYAESLIAGALEVPARRVKFTQIIERHAERLAQLVEDLLQLSSYDAGKTVAAAQAVPLRALVEKVARGLAPAARARGVSVRVQAPSALRAVMERTELTQILQNLLENAIKYNRARGRVLLRARMVGKRVLVTVQDTGIGIPKEDLPRVFDRFHRAENARLKTARGNGLGLAIVRSILASRGCRIWAESEAGKGTVMSFTLPAADAKPRARRGRR